MLGVLVGEIGVEGFEPVLVAGGHFPESPTALVGEAHGLDAPVAAVVAGFDQAVGLQAGGEAGGHLVCEGTPDDVKALAEPVLAHRIILDPEAEFDGVTASNMIAQVLIETPPPSTRQVG